MDPRVRDHAETLVDWSARIQPGDNVVVEVGEGAHDLAVALGTVLGEVGANLHVTYASGDVQTAYLGAHGGEFTESPAHQRAVYERADSVLTLVAPRNTSEGAAVPGDRRARFRRAREDVREAYLATDWVQTVHPTPALAQAAGMSTAAYADFAYDAMLRDWERLAAEMGQLKGVLDEGETVSIQKPPGPAGVATDLSLSIADRVAVNSAASVAYDSHNLPSGEVFTAPVVDSASGTVAFDLPNDLDGTTVRDAWLTLEGGEVVDWGADTGAAALTGVLETDAGARRLGELGIGMNRGIDRPTGRTLFDEKMAGTVHLALGRAYEDCLPAGSAGNDSAVHQDLITDMRGSGTRLLVDGEVIQRDGVFRWEAGFSG